jgi:hypothetical protein
MWAGGQQDRNRTTPVRWLLTTGLYSVAPTCCPLTIDNYSAGWPDNPAPRCACTRRGEATGRDGLHTVEDIICYTRQVVPRYTRIQPTGATCQALAHVWISRAKAILEQNTAIQLSFSHGHRVLRSDSLNHINSHIHCVPS